MTPWRELHRQHLSLKESCSKTFEAGVRKRLRLLVDQKHAPQALLSRFTYKISGSVCSYKIAAPGPSEDSWRRSWAEPLQGIRTGLDEAHLTVLAEIDTRTQHLKNVVIMIDGRSAGRPWVLAAHLDEQPIGAGACSHALFHCHIGESMDSLPEVRVPMPAVDPCDVLGWMICQVIDGWEPAPWGEVVP